MKFLSFALASASIFTQAVDAASVFAHVVVGNTAAHTQSTWAQDISLAQAAGIDAFALNIAYPDSNIPTQVANAFAAAEAAGSSFKLFFSFDYLGGGQAWPATGAFPDSAASYLTKYTSSAAYFKYNNEAFVSTFEGVSNTGDWAPNGAIRSAVSGGIYFVPNWDSLGTGGIGADLNNIQGYFSWQMWPVGANNMSTTIDSEWKSAVSGKTYMMGVSPWFFHSASGGKDWVWRGDDLWADRWAETLTVKPDFVEIVTWNDFGESSYIGPIHDSSEIAAGSSQYVTGMPHDSWRDFLPYYIAKYKGSSFTVTKDQMQYWYRTSPGAGNACGVVGNDADQGQTETTPAAIMEDGVYFSALLTSAASVTVKIGSGATVTKQGVAGINHWSVPLNGQTGVPVFSIVRNGATVNSSTGAQAITSSTTLSSGCVNFNAWVGSF